jgi:hypothetical protein
MNIIIAHTLTDFKYLQSFKIFQKKLFTKNICENIGD